MKTNSVTRVKVSVEAREYEAIIASGLLNDAGEQLRAIRSAHEKLFVITVATVNRLWGKQLMRSLLSAGFYVHVIEVSDGERQKKLQTIERLAEKLARLGGNRDSAVIAFGGGVVGDMSGLLASLYMRGIEFAQIPTTVLAQVDASIGGKTGVNLRAGKNLVGTFHQPRAVLIDPVVLSSLPERQFRSGLYEVLKAGIIGSCSLFEFLQTVNVNHLRENPAKLEWLVAEAVKLKAEIVSKDEKEGGLRRVLNLGHTVGHALEAAYGYRRLLHGEAVAWGLIAAAEIAESVGFLQRDVAEGITNAVLRLGPLPHIDLDRKTLFQYLRADKKNRGGHIHFILPRRVGEVEVNDAVPPKAIEEALSKIKALSRHHSARSAGPGRA